MSDWIELFNGRNFDGWASKREHQWRVAGGVRLHPENAKLFAIEPGTGIMVNGDDGRTVDIYSVQEHGSCELHLEFCVAQGSNSGVYLMGQYEIQILDSWGVPDSKLGFVDCGGIYARWVEETKTSYDGAAPRTNASRSPGEWQSFDVLFHAAKFDAAGNKIANARFERVLHNGVVVIENFACTGPTRGAWGEVDRLRGPLRLQGDHGPVAYRNVRMRLLD
ncbi:MAG: DUF1080 domain-containing protein [Armatimonadetes bacterium]|nr:DUF1080 domain-containing protein [Armatimonadota bacterium]